MDDRPLFEKPIDDLVPAGAPRRTVRDAPRPDPDRPAEEVLAIARYQALLIAFLLAHLALRAGAVALVVGLGPPALDEPAVVVVVALAVVVALVIDVFALVVFVKFAARVYSAAAVVALALLWLVPGVPLLAILVVNGRATGVLRRNGVRVGLLGARSADLDRLDPERRRRRTAQLPKLGW